IDRVMSQYRAEGGRLREEISQLAETVKEVRQDPGARQPNPVSNRDEDYSRDI
ncbi:hypothetical protein VP01_4942g2, partial [Puccinia sorghi]